MSMVNIDSLYEDTFNITWNLVQGNVTDPASRGSDKWIFAAFPDTKSGGFIGYPIIIINPIESDLHAINFSKNFWTHDVGFVVELYTSKGKQIDTVGDEIIKTLRDGASTYRAAHLHNISIGSSGTNSYIIEGKKVHYRGIWVSFDYAS